MTVAIPAPADGAAIQPVPAGDQQPGPSSPAPRPGPLTRVSQAIGIRSNWLAPLALLACFGLTVAYVEKFNPTTGDPGPTGGCAFKALTGLDCPGCGGTRAFFYLIHGNLPEAARNHVMAVFAAPFLAYAYIAWSANRMFGAKLPMLRIKPTTVSIVMAAWIAFAILRDLPWPPFTYLFV